MSAAVSPAPFDRSLRNGNRSNTSKSLVYKTGHLYILSKGLGWKSWKRRWFVLTRSSLVFYKNNPDTHPSKPGDENLTLGGIDLNNSGREWAVSGSSITNSGHVSSVLVRTEKKLLTVLFPDGRAFALKAETVEEVEEWKDALERALLAAPIAPSTLSATSSLQSESQDVAEYASEQGSGGSSRKPIKSSILGAPIVLALEDADGSPSFLEKALTFIENHGIDMSERRCLASPLWKQSARPSTAMEQNLGINQPICGILGVGVGVEGILRQSADVEDVERRVLDYEQGKKLFSSHEDAHVIGDCIKHVLRELPSSPVPTSCCTALLEAQRLEAKELRISSMKIAVTDTCPEPNRLLLLRVLRMMRAVSACMEDNRMTPSAVAACMAPLLLRPLLAGECGLDNETEISSPDNAAELLAATAAAHYAQSIATTLLEEYDHIFEDNGLQSASSSCTPEYQALEASAADGSSGEEDVEAATHIMTEEENKFHDAPNDLHEYGEEVTEHAVSCTLSESSSHIGSDTYNYKVFEGEDSDMECSSGFESSTALPKGASMEEPAGQPPPLETRDEDEINPPTVIMDNDAPKAHSMGHSAFPWGDGKKIPFERGSKSDKKSSRIHVKPWVSTTSSKRTSLWGLSSSSKKSSKSDVNAVDSSEEEELAVQRLEVMKADLRNRIEKEAKGNAILQASLERRKQALHDRRLALEQDVARLQESLQAECDSKAELENGISASFDSQMHAEMQEIAAVEADVARLKQKLAEFHTQFSQQNHLPYVIDSSERQRVKNLQAQQKILQQELDVTLALCHQEKLKNEHLDCIQEYPANSDYVVNSQCSALAEPKDAGLGERPKGIIIVQHRSSPPHDLADWRTLRPPAGPSAAGRQFAWRSLSDPSLMNPSDYDADTQMRMQGGANYSMSEAAHSGKRLHLDLETGHGNVKGPLAVQKQSSSASEAMVELTSRLHFFKERRLQLMDQLTSLDPRLIPISLTGHDLMMVELQSLANP